MLSQAVSPVCAARVDDYKERVPTKPSAILFDLDDTILRSRSDYLALWMECVEERIGDFPGLDAGALLRAIRAEADHFWSDATRHRLGRLDLRKARRDIVVHAAQELGHSYAEAATSLADRYHEQKEGGVVPFAGAVETLELVRSKAIKMALVTNGSADAQRAKIEEHELAAYFDLILIEGEFGAGKPQREVYEHVLQQLDVGASQSWMVGDNLEWEVAAPQRAGLFAIWNDHKKAGLPPGSEIKPDHIVHAISELSALL